VPKTAVLQKLAATSAAMTRGIPEINSDASNLSLRGWTTLQRFRILPATQPRFQNLNTISRERRLSLDKGHGDGQLKRIQQSREFAL